MLITPFSPALVAGKRFQHGSNLDGKTRAARVSSQWKSTANELLAKRGLAGSIQLEEGSGISRGNRFTARGLVEVLHRFEPHAALLRKGEGAFFKTGTFSGVRTLAGYADTSKHGRVRFVIALRGNDSAMRFRLLKAIQSEL
jgi:D-alanyl-D-alanine carboxypeptidase/D-alanyl-D-alanine-endopeptidase (penicillin-binding protein 4)